jgi:hypothetical protein
MVDPNTGWGYVIAQKGSNAGSPVPIGSKIPGYPLTDKSAAGLAAVAAKAGAPTLKYFQASPDYQFRLNQGVTALDRSAAARGMVLSGAQNKALTQFGQDTGASEFGNWWNRIAGIAGVGQSAANNGAATAASFSNTIGNTVQNAGDARASGYLANANLIGGGANTLAQIVSQYYNPQPKLPAPSYPTTWRNPA